jgi:hypothetical protein
MRPHFERSRRAPGGPFRDGRGRACGEFHRLGRDLLGERIPCLVSLEHAYPDPVGDIAERPVDLLVFQADGMADDVLEVQVAIIPPAGKGFGHDFPDHRFGDLKAFQKARRARRGCGGGPGLPGPGFQESRNHEGSREPGQPRLEEGPSVDSRFHPFRSFAIISQLSFSVSVSPPRPETGMKKSHRLIPYSRRGSY